MLYLALLLALVGLLAALVALNRSAALALRVDALEGAAGQRSAERGQEQERGLETLRKLVAAMAGGARLAPEQILEGRLWRDVDGAEALRLVLEEGARTLDVRTADETRAGIVPGALRVPVDQLEARLSELPRDGRATIVYCAMGSRSAYACELLSAKGFENLCNLEGGVGAWRAPLERPAQV